MASVRFRRMIALIGSRLNRARRLSWILLLLALPLAAQAQFTFVTNNDSTITITGYTGTNLNVVIPSTTNNMQVISIYVGAFMNDQFTNVTIPQTITIIGADAFSDCTRLGAITVDPANPAYSSLNGVLFDKLQSTLIQYPGGMAVGSYTVPDSVTNIGGGAFESCRNLTNATIGNGVVGIGGYAFYNCTNLAGLTVPTSVSSIGDHAFAGCGSLANIVIPAGVANVGTGVFEACTSLRSMTIPDSVTNIGDNAFHFCVNMTNITIGSNVLAIGNDAFEQCYSLANIAVPNSVRSIGYYAFEYCYSLTNITIGSGVTNIGNGLVANCNHLLAIVVDTNNPAYCSSNGVLFNPAQTFLIQFPGGKSGNYTIPDSVTNTGFEAFWNCTNLTGVTIGSGLVGVGSFAFAGCINLTNLAIGSSLTNISIIDVNDLVGLTSIIVDSNNPVYSSIGGVLFNRAQNTLLMCPEGKAGSYTIPNGVTSIGGGAFYSCANLTNVIIPNSVTNIGSFGFQYCASLVRVYFQGNAPGIGSSIFIEQEGNTIATVYYLPGTTGWTTTFANCPAVLWNPQARTGDGSFGIKTNRFGFNITGTTNIPIVVEVATNLGGPSWTPLLTGTITNGSIYFSDAQWTNYPSRYYRIRSP